MKYRIIASTVLVAFFCNVAWADEAHEARMDVEIQKEKISKKINAANIATNKAAIAAIQLTPGPQGPIGLTGAKGATGAQGPIGLTGAKGAAGAKGATGAQGPIGLTGAKGAAGAKGATGAQGPIGLTGAAGMDGMPGAPGVVGAQGPIGFTGTAGADSTVAGPAGPQGPAGPAATTIHDISDAVTLTTGNHIIICPRSHPRLWSYKHTAPPTIIASVKYLFASSVTRHYIHTATGIHLPAVYSAWYEMYDAIGRKIGQVSPENITISCTR